jgi:hypothetical protein
MKFKLEYKPKTAASGEKYLVLDTTNPFPTDNPLHKGYAGRIVAECLEREDGELVTKALNKND